jgi:hypothetical protein
MSISWYVLQVTIKFQKLSPLFLHIKKFVLKSLVLKNLIVTCNTYQVFLCSDIPIDLIKSLTINLIRSVNVIKE